MRLRGVPVAPGRAAGTVVRVGEGPVGLRAGPRPEPMVLLADRAEDLTSPVFAAGPVAALLLGDPPPSGSLPSFAGPIVAALDLELLRDGDAAEVDGALGEVELPGVDEVEVVTAFVQRTTDGKILLLRRSDRVGSFQGLWAGVSGFLEDPTPEAQAWRELREETGMTPAELTLVAEGAPVGARGDRRVYRVHPFRFVVATPSIRLDWEHAAFDWVTPEELRRRPTVPRLWEAWRAVAPPPGDGTAKETV
jgi:8-oxo-dGTP diphosphatase